MKTQQNSCQARPAQVFHRAHTTALVILGTNRNLQLFTPVMISDKAEPESYIKSVISELLAVI